MVEDILTWSNLSKSFGRQNLFRKLNGSVGDGQTVVVTGPNGSGKSTFLRILAGISTPDSGFVSWSEHARIGYCAPSLELYGELTGKENLEFFASVTGTDTGRSTKLLGEVGLSKAAGKLYSSYSSGMKQRLKIAFALLQSPNLIILDEPTIALDQAGTAIVDSIIDRHKQQGGSALIATNEPAEAQRWASTIVDLSK